MPAKFGNVAKVTPVFMSQVKRRKDKRLLPDAARGKSKYGHMRYASGF